MIQKQVKLPFRVALEVTLQGIKIRFGRSLVTVSGVLFGIAFLMSILTGIAIRKGVQSEEEKRVTINQMYNFLVAETGLLRERSIGVIQRGDLSELEIRLLDFFVGQGVTQISWLRMGGKEISSGSLPIRPTDPGKIGEGVSAILMMGESDSRSNFLWNDSLFRGARQKVLGLTQSDFDSISLESGNIVLLRAQLSDDLKAKAEKDRRTSRFRNIWIITISLFVTIIGISNSMLMSVTERFREIGTMKCLGALSSFVRQMFFFEAIVMGLAGSLAGAIAGGLFSLIVYGFIYDFAMVFGSTNYGTLSGYFLFSTVSGVLLSVIAAIYPAQFASRMVPAAALRSSI